MARKIIVDIIKPDAGDDNGAMPGKTGKKRAAPRKRIVQLDKKMDIVNEQDRRDDILKNLVNEKKALDRREEKKPERKRVFSFKRPRASAVIVAGVIVGIGACVYAFGLIATTVHIVITTQKDQQDQTLNIQFARTVASGTADILPLQWYQKPFTFTKTYQATGKEQAQEPVSVQGMVTIYNAAQQTPQVLIATTRFVSPDGKVFRLVQRTVVPGYTMANGTTTPGMVQALIRADQPGAAYAIAPTRFSLPGFSDSVKFKKIYGVSTQAFTYATDAQAVTVVTQDDITNAKQGVAQIAFDQTKQDLTKTLPDSAKLLDQAMQIKVTSTQVSAKAGAHVPEFSATIQGTLTLMIFDEQDIIRLLEKRMPFVQSETGLVATSVMLSYENPVVSFDKGTLTMTVHAKRELTPLVDSLALKQRVSERTLDDLRRELLTVAGVQQVDIVVWPFWISRVPGNVDKIDIEVR